MDYQSESFQAVALPISQITDYDPNTGTPETGEEYLLNVILERSKQPRIVQKIPKILYEKYNYKDINLLDKNIIENDGIQDTVPSALRTTKEWQTFQSEDFQNLQQKVIRMREKYQNMIIEKYTVKLPKLPPVTVSELQSGAIPKNLSFNAENELIDLENNYNYNKKWLTFCENNKTLLHILLRFEQRELEYLLELLLEWLTEAVAKCTIIDIKKPLDLCIGGDYEWLGRWIYSTLACLRSPLEPYTHNAIRMIAKQLIESRKQLDERDYDKVQPINLLICIISQNFNQLDLLILPDNVDEKK